MTIAVRDWDAQLRDTPADVTPSPDMSFLSAPEPAPQLHRTELHCVTGRNAITARVAAATGETMPLVATVPGPALVGQAQQIELIPVAAPPLAVAPRDGGVWLLGPRHVTLLDSYGDEVASFPLELHAVTLTGTGDGRVWAVGQHAAVLIDPDGGPGRPLAWSCGVGGVADGHDLVGWDRRAGALRRLSPDGSERFKSLPDPPEPFEHLVGVHGEELIVSNGWRVRRLSARVATDRARALVVHGAGLTDDGRAFVSGRIGDAVHVHVAGGPDRRLALPGGVDPLLAYRVVGFRGERALVIGADRGLWYDDGNPVASVALDDAAVWLRLFSSAWELAGELAALRVPELGWHVVASASGPTGLAIIGVPLPAD